MRARRVLWVLAVVATTVNGFVVGYGAVWFQLFGEQADRGDYLTSAGGYLGAAAVLALAGTRSLSTGLSLEGPTGSFGGLDDGLGGVVLLPWCWLLLWAAGHSSLDRLRRS